MNKDKSTILIRTTVGVLLACSALAVSSASAATIVLTFEGGGDSLPIGNFYNGGAGPNYGISFGSDALTIISDQHGGTGNFAGNPSGVTALFFLTGPGDVMNIAAGFTTGFSFFYSAINDPGTVTVYSGLNDTGTILATLTLPITGSQAGNALCGSDQFCPFVPFGVTFSGTAMSVDFSGTANQIAFDDVTLGSSTPGTGTPEPATYALTGSSLLAVFAYSLRKRRSY